MLDKWQALSGDLGISQSFVKRLKAEQRTHGMSEIDIMTDVLHEWRSRKSKSATLYELVSQLEENEMEQLAGKFCNSLTYNWHCPSRNRNVSNILFVNRFSP